MKRFLALGLTLALTVGLVGCETSGVSQGTDAPEKTIQPASSQIVESQLLPTPAPTPLSQPEQVTYDDILSGNYNGEMVYIDCAISGVEPGVTDYISFNAWVGNGKQYVYDGHWIVFDLNKADTLSDLKDAKSGDIYRLCVKVNADTSFGGTGVLSAEKLNITVDIPQLEQEYKDTCTTYTCEELLRDPENFKGEKIKISGDVFQIISDDGSNVEILLDTGEKNGLTYIKYNRSEDEERILEGDNIAVYGTFYKLSKYTSVLGTENTVPELYANFLDRIS